MAPSRLVTVAATSAILLGVVFMIYLVRRRKRQRKDKGTNAQDAKPVDLIAWVRNVLRSSNVKSFKTYLHFFFRPCKDSPRMISYRKTMLIKRPFFTGVRWHWLCVWLLDDYKLWNIADMSRQFAKTTFGQNILPKWHFAEKCVWVWYFAKKYFTE